MVIKWIGPFDQQKKKYVLIAVLCLLVGGIIGYGYGFQKGSIQSLVWGVGVAKNFVTIEFDAEEIASMMWAYKNRIDVCYNGKKTSLSIPEEPK